MRFDGFKALLYYLRGVNKILPTFFYAFSTCIIV